MTLVKAVWLLQNRCSFKAVLSFKIKVCGVVFILNKAVLYIHQHMLVFSRILEIFWKYSGLIRNIGSQNFNFPRLFFLYFTCIFISSQGFVSAWPHFDSAFINWFCWPYNVGFFVQSALCWVYFFALNSYVQYFFWFSGCILAQILLFYICWACIMVSLSLSWTVLWFDMGLDSCVAHLLY